MKKPLYILPILFALCAFENAFAQKKTVQKQLKKAIINGKANYLPKPDYPKQAEDLCVGGKVEVEVEVVYNASNVGEVVSARAVSGDELLRKSAEEAALKARFSPHNDLYISKIDGLVVYNFVPEKKCIESGVVNKKAKYLAKPKFNGKVSRDFEMRVRVLIDSASGKVIAAKALEGHPLIRAASEKAALETRFTPFTAAGPVFVKAVIVYKFKTDGKIETDFPKD